MFSMFQEKISFAQCVLSFTTQARDAGIKPENYSSCVKTLIRIRDSGSVNEIPKQDIEEIKELCKGYLITNGFEMSANPYKGLYEATLRHLNEMSPTPEEEIVERIGRKRALFSEEDSSDSNNDEGYSSKRSCTY